jgi:two-component system nitrogen regulation response regulator NtrX
MLPVVMISGHGNIETAVSAINSAPMISSKSRSRRTAPAGRGTRARSLRLKREVTELRTRAGGANRIVGKSAVINQLRHVIERVGPANCGF